MSLRRYAETDEQEKALGEVERWAKSNGVELRFGTTVGKSPQTVILDHNFQDNLVSVNRDGKVRVCNEEVHDKHSFKEAYTKCKLRYG